MNPDREIELETAFVILAAEAAKTAPVARPNGDQGGDGQERRVDWRDAFDKLLAGDEYHPTLVPLAASFAARGMPEAAAYDVLCSLLLNSNPHDPERRRRCDVEMAKLAGTVTSAYAKFGTGDAAGAGAEPPAWPERGKLIAPLRPVKVFVPTTLLPEALRGWVVDEARRMPCSPDFVAVAALVALASVVGARCVIRPKIYDPWAVVPNLWGAPVADPGRLKSPAIDAGLKPLRALIERARAAFEEEMQGYKIEEKKHAAMTGAAEDDLKKAAKNKDNLDEIAHELHALGANAPKAPVERRYRTNDVTVEKLGELLRDNPHGLLIDRDELVGLLASWERDDRAGDKAFFLEAHNGNQSFDTDRIGRGHIHIPNLCVSIFGGIQPDKLSGYLELTTNSLENDGTLQRFQMLVYPDPHPWGWVNEPPDLLARDRAFAVFEKLAAFDPMEWDAQQREQEKFPSFQFDDEAQDVFIAWSHDLHVKRIAGEDDPLIRQHLAKYEKLFAALALIFHLIDRSEGRGGKYVAREAARRAAAWCAYLESHARRCYGLLGHNRLRNARVLAGKLERGALTDGFTARDVRRHQWTSLQTEEAVAAALDWLEAEAWIRGVAKPGGQQGGRPTKHYEIHPDLKGDRGG